MDKSITNRVYNLCYYVHTDFIFVCNFEIKNKYRGRHYSIRIFNNIMKKLNKSELHLECFETLIPFYSKLGFILLEQVDEFYYRMAYKKIS